MTTQAHVEAPAEFVIPKLWDKAKIKSDQDEIKALITDIDARAHANALQCMIHASVHGDTSLMRRFFVDIIPAKATGYRREGAIVWMRKYSPMELKGDTINLTGVLADGKTRRPWRLEEAAQNWFVKLREADEQVRPLYRDNLLSSVRSSSKRFREAMRNTVLKDGKPSPIDAAKPYFDGIHADKVEAAFDEIDKAVVSLDAYRDTTKIVRDAQAAVNKANAELEALGEQTEPVEVEAVG